MKDRSPATWVAYFIALVAFIAGIVVEAVGNTVLGSVVLAASLVVGCTTYLAERIDQIQAKVVAEIPAMQAFAGQLEANSAAARIVGRASNDFRQLVSHVAQGRVPVSSDRELIDGLIDIVKSARRTINAVDRFSLTLWLTSERFERVQAAHRDAAERGVRVTRIRIVESAMLMRTDFIGDQYRSALFGYAQLQKAMGVNLYWLLDQTLIEMELPGIERGWMLADHTDRQLVAATYGILQEGVVKEGAILLGDSPEIRRLANDFERLFAASQDSDVADLTGV